MNSTKRVVGLVALILVVVAVMALFSSLPNTGISISGRTIEPVNGVEDDTNMRTLAKALGIEGATIPETMTLGEAILRLSFARNNIALVNDFLLTINGADISSDMTIGEINKNLELVQKIVVISTIVQERSRELST